MVVWFKFPLGTESLETIEEFNFKNGRIISKSKPIITQVNNKIIARYQVTAEITTSLNFNRFPFGGHRLHIVMENRRVSPRELSFIVDPKDLILSDQLDLSTWQARKLHANAGYAHATIEKDNTLSGVNYPTVVYAIDFTNKSMRTTVSLFLPMFLLFFLCMITFVAPLIDPFRIQLLAAAMPTLVLFRLVVDAQSPSGVTLTEADYIYFLLVTLSLFILLFNTYILIKKGWVKQIPETEKEQWITGMTDINNLLFLGISVLLGVALALILI
jgi:hypothetical protein